MKVQKPESEQMWSTEATFSVFLSFFSDDSDATCSGSEIHRIHSVTHDMNTKPSWINWVGIHLNPWHLDSQGCQVQNSRKPPAFKDHSIEEEVPTLTFCPSGQVEMEFRCRLICRQNVSKSQNLNQVRLKIQTARPLKGLKIFTFAQCLVVWEFKTLLSTVI